MSMRAFVLILSMVAWAIAAPSASASQASHGRILPVPGKPAWLGYEDGTPFFMCGPGDPEGFLYRGTRNPDGTRNGDQMALIEKLAASGANSIYLMAVRSHGGDGDETQNPFVDGRSANKINPAVLDQWNTWFEEMDRNGIVIYFFFYDDSARIWDTGDIVGQNERKFIRQLVKRFQSLDNLIWVVAEEYQERYTAARVSAIAREIRAADDRDHAVAVHLLNGLDFSKFADDPNIDQFAIQYNDASTRFELHDAIVAAWRNAGGRYNLNMAEIAYGGVGSGPTARGNVWSIVMGGAYVMLNGMDIATTPQADLVDCGRVVEFMTSTDFIDMAPHDELATGETDFLLALPGRSYIAYTGALSKWTLFGWNPFDWTSPGKIGVRGMTAGKYGFRWLDLATGRTVTESDVEVGGGDRTWARPPGFGREVAVYIWRQ